MCTCASETLFTKLKSIAIGIAKPTHRSVCLYYWTHQPYYYYNHSIRRARGWAVTFRAADPSDGIFLKSPRNVRASVCLSVCAVECTSERAQFVRVLCTSVGSDGACFVELRNGALTLSSVYIELPFGRWSVNLIHKFLGQAGRNSERCSEAPIGTKINTLVYVPNFAAHWNFFSWNCKSFYVFFFFKWATILQYILSLHQLCALENNKIMLCMTGSSVVPSIKFEAGLHKIVYTSPLLGRRKK